MNITSGAGIVGSSGRHSRNLPDAFRVREEVRMDCRCQSVESMQQRRGWSVQKCIADAVDATGGSGTSILPSAIDNDLFQGNTISGSAPGRHDDLRIKVRDLTIRERAPGFPQEFAAGRFHQLCDPRLGCDDRFSPLFAKNSQAWPVAYLPPHTIDVLLHCANYSNTAVAVSDSPSNGGDVGVNVSQRFRSQAEKA